jgi:hypothetical protein
MSTSENANASGQSALAKWVQIIGGTIVLLIVATVGYAVLLTIAGILPAALWDRFGIGGNALRVIIAAAAGMWLGASAMKFAFPRVDRKPVFAFIAILMTIAIIGGLYGMALRGNSYGWEGVVSSIVFLISGGMLLLEDKSWQDLPGRKAT